MECVALEPKLLESLAGPWWKRSVVIGRAAAWARSTTRDAVGPSNLAASKPQLLARHLLAYIADVRLGQASRFAKSFPDLFFVISVQANILKS